MYFMKFNNELKTNPLIILQVYTSALALPA